MDLTTIKGIAKARWWILVGAAILAVTENLLNLLGVSPFSQQIVKGLIILGAVLLERRVPMLTGSRTRASRPNNGNGEQA